MHACEQTCNGTDVFSYALSVYVVDMLSQNTRQNHGQNQGPSLKPLLLQRSRPSLQPLAVCRLIVTLWHLKYSFSERKPARKLGQHLQKFRLQL